MKLSELITTLQSSLEANGDTDEIALCFAIVSFPVAFFAVHINIRQEIHFNHFHSPSFTYFASATFNIKRKTTGSIAPDFSFWYGSKQGSDFGKESAIRGWIASWCSTDWRLINFNHFINMLQPLHRMKRHGRYFTIVTMLGQNRIQGFINQSALTTTTNATHYY